MKIKIWFFWFLLYAFYFLLPPTYAQSLQLWNINLNFCNNWENINELDLTAKAWEEVPICINFINTDQEDITINIDFLDATITQDDFKNRSCNAADRPKQYFGNFMVNYDKTVTIKWNSTIQKTYNIKFPVWYKWISHGCVAYNQIQTGNNTNQSMLNIVVRKVKFIDIFAWETQIKSQINIQKIKTIKSWNMVNFQIWLKNIWNTDQKIIFSWTISNKFWFKDVLIFNENTADVAPSEEIQIQTNNENLILPVYKWFFTVDFEIANKPIFNFNISADNNIPEDVILGWNFKISKTIFISNPYFIWILIIFLILIYIAIFKKRKRQIIYSQPEITNNL